MCYANFGIYTFLITKVRIRLKFNQVYLQKSIALKFEIDCGFTIIQDIQF